MTKSIRTLSMLERPHGADEMATALIDEVTAGARSGRVGGPERTTTGVVEDISPDGVAIVVLSGEVQSRPASSVLRFPSAAAASEALLGRQVLVVVTENARPVIVGVVEERLWEARGAEVGSEVEATVATSEPMTVQLDKRRLQLEAADEIRLTCGKSSLVLRRDGTVVIRGVNIVSRALQTNKIRGGSVSVN
jgi:hypothetical protein